MTGRRAEGIKLAPGSLFIPHPDASIDILRSLKEADSLAE
jgi:hypothetical protein